MKAKELIKLLKGSEECEVLIGDVYIGCDTLNLNIDRMIHYSKGDKICDGNDGGDFIKNDKATKDVIILKTRIFN